MRARLQLLVVGVPRDETRKPRSLLNPHLNYRNSSRRSREKFSFTKSQKVAHKSQKETERNCLKPPSFLLLKGCFFIILNSHRSRNVDLGNYWHHSCGHLVERETT